VIEVPALSLKQYDGTSGGGEGVKGSVSRTDPHLAKMYTCKLGAEEVQFLTGIPQQFASFLVHRIPIRIADSTVLQPLVPQKGRGHGEKISKLPL
jgi:hypothetical protein